MASTIASPVPLRFNQSPRTTNEREAVDPGRDTPLPQYEKTQSVPVTLKLQEDAQNPGRFQLVLDIGAKLQSPDGLPLNTLFNLPNTINSATKGDENSSRDTSSPPTTPLSEKQGWADLDHVPPEFLNKVVPDWNVSFSRSDSTVSTQTKRLAEIKAKIKKKGKGYVVRLLKGSATDSNEIAEVDLGSDATRSRANISELDSAILPAELHSVPFSVPSNSISPVDGGPICEIGTSNEDGIRRPQDPIAPGPDSNSETHARLLEGSRLVQISTTEEGMSDAETLISDLRPIDRHVDGEQTFGESLRQSDFLTPIRSGSVSSIVKTPTRGLSLIGPVRKRVEKKARPRINCRTANMNLKRSDAHKSIKSRSNSTTIETEDWFDEFGTNSTNMRQCQRLSPRKSKDSDRNFQDHGTWQNSIRHTGRMRPRNARHSSVDDLQVPAKSKYGLRLQTNVPKTRSAHVSPVTQRKGPPNVRKQKSSSNSPGGVYDDDVASSPELQEASHSEVLREALRALSDIVSDPSNGNQGIDDTQDPAVHRLAEPVNKDCIGDIVLPSETEIRSAPSGVRNPALVYWALAFGALSDKVYEGFKVLRDVVGPERPVPRGHVRVRWTCSCGESLYDDFIEQRPNAARLLEAYLNRPRVHTYQSPASQSSTVSSVSSIFDSSSRASTLATPSSTYGGSAPWSRGSDPSKYNPSRVRADSAFSVRMPNYAEESWLLTCANEGRLTPKIVHLDVNEGRIRSDKDLALSLREHYDQLHRRWYDWTRLRGLTTIEFVQFEVHRNRFADIRAAPSMPPKSATSSVSAAGGPEKSQGASQHPYTFEPNDLLPPVGSTYLLHLFKHPNDYDSELVTYLRSPKRRQRLEFGMGWGVHLVEGFLAQRVWAFTVGICGLSSAVFAALWAIMKEDVQGAFGVAQWVLGLAVLMVGGIQAWLE
ncbi:hypothetical protein COCMIDRAFT_37109 [Bipolaris oryzae ATCC 44560]|uniref:Uncharacterized protein n=1 Tax=Bipolaris oryzae ATCC 44560 TaxID=930090 RepID=W6Z0B9_COCMI|nr:uncharacterized protein COCMIDRAFT_37109 [Bipolaris oryzae ATCC 44560]EUC45147.1 hypothetical protein COCMIDRAFT_37109 [Bipolaris oryzae ATCC 44560]